MTIHRHKSDANQIFSDTEGGHRCLFGLGRLVHKLSLIHI